MTSAYCQPKMATFSIRLYKIIDNGNLFACCWFSWKINMKVNLKLIILILLLVSSRIAYGISLPVYLGWRSSNSYIFYNLKEDETGNLSETYKIKAGIDTLFTFGMRARLELTNQEEGLFSQAVLNHAIIDYICDDFEVQLSMQDFGYGKDFFLNTRRTDNPFYDKNVLLNYRWHGISPSFKHQNHVFSAGLGGNELNRLLAQMNWKLQSEMFSLNAFCMYAHNDNLYSIKAIYAGTDISFLYKRLELRSGFVYDFYPKSKRLPQMDSQHLINELGIRANDTFRFIISSEYQTYPNSSKTDYQYEICLSATYKNTESFVGVNLKSLPEEKAYAYFLDVNVLPLSSLSIGLCFDYVSLTRSDNYVKVGLQTRYRMK